MKNKLKGGLINELELRIEKLTNLSNHLEIKIKLIENENSHLHKDYSQSFNISNEVDINFKNILDYRQSIVDNLCNNNNYIEQLEVKLNETIKTCNFLKKIYFYLNKN